MGQIHRPALFLAAFCVVVAALAAFDVRIVTGIYLAEGAARARATLARILISAEISGPRLLLTGRDNGSWRARRHS